MNKQKKAQCRRVLDKMLAKEKMVNPWLVQAKQDNKAILAYLVSIGGKRTRERLA